MRYVLVTLAMACTVCVESDAVGAERSLDFEVLIGSDAPLEAAHDWLQVLERLKVDHVTIRGQRASDKGPSIRGAEAGSRRVQVTAVLTSDNRLVVPELSFRRTDTGRISEWIARLRADTAPLRERERNATPDQLAQLRRQMSGHIDSTQDTSIVEFLEKARQEWDVPIAIDRAVQVQLNGKVLDNLSGLSRGTALAIAVRPYGGVVAPSSDGKSLIITRWEKADQTWPIGWRSDQPLPNVVPKLVDSLNVEVKDAPLLDVLDAIQKKVDIPFVIDHAELRRSEIDLTSIKVSIRPRRVMYKKVLDGILVQNFLSGEVRVDEAGSPFYWITTLKRDQR